MLYLSCSLEVNLLRGHSWDPITGFVSVRSQDLSDLR